MDIKKDPGKFTIRFCMADPRQMKAVDELNAQGRLKAQFLTNAILHYVEGTATLPPQEELESILERLMKRMLDDRADMGTAKSHRRSGWDFLWLFRYVYRSSISMEMDTPWVFEYFIEI